MKTTLYRSSRLLSFSDRRKVVIVIILQIMFGLLDLVGVGLIGVLGAIAISGVGLGTREIVLASLLNYLA